MKVSRHGKLLAAVQRSHNGVYSGLSVYSTSERGYKLKERTSHISRGDNFRQVEWSPHEDSTLLVHSTTAIENQMVGSVAVWRMNELFCPRSVIFRQDVRVVRWSTASQVSDEIACAFNNCLAIGDVTRLTMIT